MFVDNELCDFCKGVIMVTAALPRTTHFCAPLRATACVHQHDKNLIFISSSLMSDLTSAQFFVSLFSLQQLSFRDAGPPVSSVANFLSSHLCSNQLGLAAESWRWAGPQPGASCYFRQRRDAQWTLSHPQQPSTTVSGITEAVVTALGMCYIHEVVSPRCRHSGFVGDKKLGINENPESLKTVFCVCDLMRKKNIIQDWPRGGSMPLSVLSVLSYYSICTEDPLRVYSSPYILPLKQAASQGTGSHPHWLHMCIYI